MANKRESSNQKRQRANRAQREALAARTAAASTPRPSRQAPKAVRRTGGEAKERRVDATTPDTPAQGPKGAKTKGGRPQRERRPRLGDRPVDLDTLEGSWFRKIVQVPGGSQILVAFGITIVTAGFLSFQKFFVSQRDALVRAGEVLAKGGTKGVEDAPLTQTLFDVLGLPKGLLVLGIPILVASFALFATLRPWRRRAWTGSALAFGALILVGGVLYFNFIFSGGLIAFALFRASKVEGPAEPMFGSRRRRPRGVEEVEGEAVDDEEVDQEEADDDLADDDDDYLADDGAPERSA